MSSELEASIRRLEDRQAAKRSILRDAGERVAQLEQNFDLKPKTARFGTPRRKKPVDKGVTLNFKPTGCTTSNLMDCTVVVKSDGYTMATKVTTYSSPANFTGLPDGVLDVYVTHPRYDGERHFSYTTVASHTYAPSQSLGAPNSGYQCIYNHPSPISKTLRVTVGDYPSWGSGESFDMTMSTTSLGGGSYNFTWFGTGTNLRSTITANNYNAGTSWKLERFDTDTSSWQTAGTGTSVNMIETSYPIQMYPPITPFYSISWVEVT